MSENGGEKDAPKPTRASRVEFRTEVTTVVIPSDSDISENAFEDIYDSAYDDPDEFDDDDDYDDDDDDDEIDLDAIDRVLYPGNYIQSTGGGGEAIMTPQFTISNDTTNQLNNVSRPQIQNFFTTPRNSESGSRGTYYRLKSQLGNTNMLARMSDLQDSQEPTPGPSSGTSAQSHQLTNPPVNVIKEAKHGLGKSQSEIVLKTSRSVSDPYEPEFHISLSPRSISLIDLPIHVSSSLNNVITELSAQLKIFRLAMVGARKTLSQHLFQHPEDPDPANCED